MADNKAGPSSDETTTTVPDTAPAASASAQQPTPAAADAPSPAADPAPATTTTTTTTTTEPPAAAVPSSSSAPPPAADVPIIPHIPNVGGIEAESFENTDDEDSTYGDSDLNSYTTSLKSSVVNYKFENGRRYHGFKDDPYWLPNDEEEMDRLDMQHHLMTMIKGDKLHLAPIGDSPQRILDIGTGTGIWAIEMGDKYPSAEVTGNDISPIQPSLVPPNVKFEVDDAEAEWIYSAPFDFIHSRYMIGSIRDWPRLARQAYNFTKPGGWVEFTDYDTQFYTSTNGNWKGESEPIDVWSKRLAEGMGKFGMDANPGPRLEGLIKDAGFVNVESKVLPFPVGTWPKDRRLKEIGAFNLVHFLEGLEPISLRCFTNGLGWSVEEVQVFLAQLRPEFKKKDKRIQHNLYVVYGQRPQTDV